jgi:hypothetical protein
MLLSRKYLRPVRVPLAAENPAAHVLRLNYKDSEGRHEDVIDLRRAVCSRNDDAVNAPVGILIQEHPHSERCHSLADPPFPQRS